MSKILLIFDYFKETFHLNKQNKALYTPQIALIAIRVLIITVMGVGIYKWIGEENLRNLWSMQSQEILSFALSQGLKIFLVILAYTIISVAIEAGLLNMYKKTVTQEYTNRADFWKGISKYFLKLLTGEILILFCYIIASPLYIIIGILTLTAGLTVIPILAGIFLSMWKVSMVMNDSGIFSAVKDSFSFAKKNFMPLALLQIIHFAFSQAPVSGSANFNLPSSAEDMPSDSLFTLPGIEEGLEQVVQVLKIAAAVLIPIAAAATIGASIISMIFEVFFSLSLFVAYKNDFKVEAPRLEINEEVEQ